MEINRIRVRNDGRGRVQGAAQVDLYGDWIIFYFDVIVIHGNKTYM